MIDKTDAIRVFQQNMGRTEALIEAMDRIKAYNRLYQMRESIKDPQYAKSVAEIQDRQLAWIESSCAEHAIVSLATAFETYCEALVQELLASYPDFFSEHSTDSTSRVRELIESEEKVSWAKIEETLKLRNRYDYYRFFDDYSIPFLSQKERELVEYIVTRRNNFVHDAGKLDEKTARKLQQIPRPIREEPLRTEAKRLCTKFGRTMVSVHGRVLSAVAGWKPNEALL
jgi:hypothetical protein